MIVIIANTTTAIFLNNDNSHDNDDRRTQTVIRKRLDSWVIPSRCWTREPVLGVYFRVVAVTTSEYDMVQQSSKDCATIQSVLGIN